MNTSLSGTGLQQGIQTLSARLLEIEQDFARRFKPPLVPQEVAVLRCLDQAGQLKMSAIGDELSIPLSTSTYLIDKLEKRCLVTRVRSAEDRRAVHVELTSKGRQAATRIRNAQVALCEELLASFGATERVVLRRLLDQLMEVN